MKRYLTLIIVALSLLTTNVQEGRAAKNKGVRVLNFCEMVGNWKKYNRRKVRVRAIYVEGAEQASLHDPDCQKGEGLTYVLFADNAKGPLKKIDRLVAKDRRASVILEGIFYGPEPFDYIDPKLPPAMREALKKSHRRYGHMDAFDTMIEVTKVIEVAEVPTRQVEKISDSRQR
jgi:hypothetical protein